MTSQPASFEPLYALNISLTDKIETVAKRIYHAGSVSYTPEAQRQLAELKRLGFDGLPICVAKTQYSFSDDPTLLGAPSDYTLTVREVKVSAGAGFVVVLTGSIMTMPGLPKAPVAWGMDIDEDGVIVGLS